jgi:hypothetical protein
MSRTRRRRSTSPGDAEAHLLCRQRWRRKPVPQRCSDCLNCRRPAGPGSERAAPAACCADGGCRRWPNRRPAGFAEQAAGRRGCRRRRPHCCRRGRQMCRFARTHAKTSRPSVARSDGTRLTLLLTRCSARSASCHDTRQRDQQGPGHSERLKIVININLLLMCAIRLGGTPQDTFLPGGKICRPRGAKRFGVIASHKCGLY